MIKKQMTIDVLNEVCPKAAEWEIMRELSYLDVKSDVLWRAFETLSNGEQTKVLLAALFLKDGHFLLIDEPTNHLDATARKKVSEFLEKRKDLYWYHMTVNFWTDVLTTYRQLIEVI